jgi:polar amino acid transport system ATP-binding protein
MKLRLESVSKSFGGRPALHSISLDVQDLHSLVLIGPSGSGKSTLLRILGGLEAADSGSVEVNGERLSQKDSELQQYRRSIGTVFQAFNLFPHLTALANITLPLEKVHQVSPRSAEEMARTQLARFGLEAHAHKTPAQLSGGQRQRVAIARALSIKPRLMLFDELRNEGRDLIVVTHQMAFARRVADRAVFLADGEIREEGPVSQLFDAPSHPKTADFLSKVLKY